MGPLSRLSWQLVTESSPDTGLLPPPLPPAPDSRKRILTSGRLEELLPGSWIAACDLDPDLRVVVKQERFTAPGILRTLGRTASSFRELRSLLLLDALGVPALEPVAAFEVRSGLLVERTGLVTREIPDSFNLSTWYRDPTGAPRERLPPARLLAELPRLARIFAGLHRHRFYGDTLLAKNILVPLAADGTPDFRLHDLPRARYIPGSPLQVSRAAHDLACLDRWASLWLHRGDRWRLLEVYLRELGEGPPARVWARQVERRRRRFHRETWPSWASHWIRRRLKQIPITGRWIR